MRPRLVVGCHVRPQHDQWPAARAQAEARTLARPSERPAAARKRQRLLCGLGLILVALLTWGLLAHADSLAQHVTPWRAVGVTLAQTACWVVACWAGYRWAILTDAQHGRGR